MAVELSVCRDPTPLVLRVNTIEYNIAFKAVKGYINIRGNWAATLFDKKLHLLLTVNEQRLTNLGYPAGDSHVCFELSVAPKCYQKVLVLLELPYLFW